MNDVCETYGFEDSPVTFMRRITGHNGDYIVQADITSIAWKVYDLADTSTTVATGTCVVASTVSNSLVTGDSRWTRDDTGYNWIYTMAGTSFPTGKRTYWVEFTFTPASGGAFVVVFKHYAEAIYGS